MKRITILLLTLQLVTLASAQTYTFNMRHNDTGTSYNVSIDVSRKQIIAQTNNINEFSCYFYNHKISDSVIGLSFTNSNSVPMPPTPLPIFS